MLPIDVALVPIDAEFALIKPEVVLMLFTFVEIAAVFAVMLTMFNKRVEAFVLMLAMFD